MAVPTVINDENFYKGLDPILDEINQKCVRMDENIKKKYVNIILEIIIKVPYQTSHLNVENTYGFVYRQAFSSLNVISLNKHSVVNVIIEELKSTDEVFNKLYSTLEYVGSYFDGLRVAKPTEFDLNLIMKIPCDYQRILVENANVKPGFVTIKISNAIIKNQISEKVFGTIEKWCDKDGYLLENKVREWMEGVITRWLGHGTKILSVPSGESVKVRVRKSGPAFTLNVDIGSDAIDVDLVFTIQFPETKRPPSSIRWNNDLAGSWVIVPKQSNDPRFWRVSFPYSEKKLIHSQYKLKSINRFLKALRDSLNLQIPSYFIKSLFLWEAHECTVANRARFWEKRQGYLFVYMLNKLYSCLNAYEVPFYWHSNSNMFENSLARIHAQNMANQISRIISKINDFIIKNDNVGLRHYIFLDLF